MPKSALPFNDGELQQEAAVNFDKDMILDLMFYALGSLTFAVSSAILATNVYGFVTLK
jgi:hypothetical protein